MHFESFVFFKNLYEQKIVFSIISGTPIAGDLQFRAGRMQS